MFKNWVRLALLGQSLIGSSGLAESSPAAYQNPNTGSHSAAPTAVRPSQPAGYQNPNRAGSHQTLGNTPLSAPGQRRAVAPGVSAPKNPNSPAFSELEALYNYTSAGSGQVRSTSIAPLLSSVDKSMTSLTLCNENGAQGRQAIVLFHFFNNLQEGKDAFRFGLVAQPIEKINEPAKFRLRADDAVKVLSDTEKYSKDQVEDAKMIEQLVRLNRQRFDAGESPSTARLSKATPIKDSALYFHRFTGPTTPGGLKGDKPEGPYTSYSIRQVQLPVTGERTYVIRVEEGVQKWNSLKNDYDRTVSRLLYCR